MGAACCVAAKDRTIISGSPSEIQQRHSRYSPSWSFRWDNRGRVAGEETSANWLHDAGGGNDRIERKSSTAGATAFASEEGSPLDSSRSLVWQKSPITEGNARILRLQSSSNSIRDQASSQNAGEVKESIESPPVSYPSPVKLSPTIPSVSSLSASPLSSQGPIFPPNSTPSRWHHRSPGHRLLRQASDSRVPEYKSPTFSISEESPSFQPSAWGNESNHGSNDGSSDSWSIPAFNELLNNRRERWSFDSEASGFSREKISRSSGRNSRSLSFDLQNCGVCTKLLSERPIWGWNNQKMISTNEIAVVSVLICGHVYHSECLEYMTPDINKYDPACPVCTLGEKRIAKMSEKAFKAEVDAMGKKRSKKRVVDDSDHHSGILFDRQKSSGVEGNKGPKMRASSSMGKPFLKRHFSFGSKPSRSLSENQSTRKKGFFWAKSSREYDPV